MLKHRKAHQDQRQDDNTTIENAIQSAMLDSGSSSTFIQNANGFECTGPSNIIVSTANKGTLTSTGQVSLPLRKLSRGARTAHVLPGLRPKALMSVRMLADNGYMVVFHPHQQGVTVHDDIKLTSSKPAVLQGWRDATGMWTGPIVDEAAVTPSLNVDEAAMSVYELPSTKEVVRFLHAVLVFPTKATLLTAARKGNLITFPGLTPENILKHFPESDETIKGHMKQVKQGVRSTKVIAEDAMLDSNPTPGVKHKDVYLRVFDATKKAMYTDQTGKFPITSARGHKYIMVAVELDGNYIDVQPLKTRQA